MSSFFAHITPVLGLFPITALITAGCLWGLFKLTIGMKCHPGLSQHFILWGLCIVTSVNFINLAPVSDKKTDFIITDTDSPDTRYPREYEGATISINDKGTAHLSHFRPDLYQYTDVEKTSQPELNRLEHLLKKIYAIFYTNIAGQIYITGIVCVILYLGFQLLHLEQIKKQSYKEYEEKGISLYKSYYTLPFSYAKNIFLPVTQTKENLDYILAHEKSHIRHKHFYKLCLLMIAAAFNWYNPFVWLLLAENKILQEMEADNDVMQEGCLPDEYQMNLLRMAIKDKEWVWIRSSYNRHPLKKRILFMNDSINLKQSRIIAWLATLMFLIVTSLVLGCSADIVHSSMNEEYFYNNRTSNERNVLNGCWYLEGISPDTACTRIYPPKEECYKFYGKNIATTLILYKNNYSNINIRFNASGKTYKTTTDSTISECGNYLKYRITNHNEMMLTADNPSDSKKGERQMSERWKRMADVPEGIGKIIRDITGDKQTTHSFKGSWRLVCIENETSHTVIQAAPNVYKIYGDDTYLIFHSVKFTEKAIDYSFEGHCGAFTYISDKEIVEQSNTLNMEWIDKDSYYLTYSDYEGIKKEMWTRTPLHPDYKRILEDMASAIFP